MKRGWNILIWGILILIISIFVSRLTTPREIDDVNPLRNCEQKYLQKAEILWIIPLYKNIPISENKVWCEEVLAMNKTIGMHGMHHSYNEFESEINESELNYSLEIFEDCFGHKPKMFKAPNLALTKENKILLEEYGLEVRTPYHQTIHKVYHCNDSGTFSNKFHDLI